MEKTSESESVLALGSRSWAFWLIFSGCADGRDGRDEPSARDGPAKVRHMAGMTRLGVGMRAISEESVHGGMAVGYA